MPDRTRPIRKEICLNEQEMNLSRQKMAQLGTANFGASSVQLVNDYPANLTLLLQFPPVGLKTNDVISIFLPLILQQNKTIIFFHII